MALAKTDIAPIQSIVGISTVGIYTNPASTKTYIKAFTLHNAGVATAFCSLHQVANVGGSVGTAASTNQFFSQYLNIGETTFVEYPYPITITATNDSIRLYVGTADGRINVQILGDRDP